MSPAIELEDLVGWLVAWLVGWLEPLSQHVAAACLLRHRQTIGGRWVGVPRAVSFYGLLSGPPNDPPLNISEKSNFPHWVSTPFLLETDRSARVPPRIQYGSGRSRLALRATFQV